MRISITGRAKTVAVIAAFAAITCGGLLLQKLENDKFVIETIPAYNSTLAETETAEPTPAAAYASEDDMIIDGKININTASAEVLTRLDGIGEVTARRIIEYREAHGGFTDAHELTEVSGIGEKKLEKIIDDICVN